MIEGYNSLPPPTSASYEATFASANLPSLPNQLNYTSNTASLHTVSTCALRQSGLQTGTTETTVCDAAANMNSVRLSAAAGLGLIVRRLTLLLNRSQGCGIDLGPNTAGNGWNSGGGGLYVLWRDTQRSGSITVYAFPRSSNAIPGDLLAENGSVLSPRDWTVTPAANFSIPQCANSTFNSHAVVINTALCGDLAGNVWGASGCNVASATCAQFVKENAAAFQDAYWGIRSLKIYTVDGNTAIVEASAGLPSVVARVSFLHLGSPADMPLPQGRDLSRSISLPSGLQSLPVSDSCCSRPLLEVLPLFRLHLIAHSACCTLAHTARNPLRCTLYLE